MSILVLSQHEVLGLIQLEHLVLLGQLGGLHLGQLADHPGVREGQLGHLHLGRRPGLHDGVLGLGLLDARGGDGFTSLVLATLMAYGANGAEGSHLGWLSWFPRLVAAGGH